MQENKKKPQQARVTEEIIREEAYHIWEREGHPSDRAMDHWLEAEKRAGTGRRVRPKGTARTESTTKTTRKKTAVKKKTAKTTARKPTKRTKKS